MINYQSAILVNAGNKTRQKFKDSVYEEKNPIEAKCEHSSDLGTKRQRKCVCHEEFNKQQTVLREKSIISVT